MKSLIVIGLCTVSLVVSCAKPPSYNGRKALNLEQKPEASNPNSNISPAPATGPMPVDPLPATTKPYLGLKCDNPSTQRGLRNWRRLSQIEMINTVKDVFQIPATTDLSQITNDIPKKIPFDTVASEETNMDVNRLKGYLRFAEAVAAATDLGKIFPCLAQKEQCVSMKVMDVAAAAWRRPPLANEVQNLTTLFKQLLDDGNSPEASFRGLITAMILSPNFMYRTELGKNMGNDQFELDSWEIASALSYMITRHPPDAKLKELAAKDALKDSEMIVAEANRLFADPKAREGMRDFAALWFSSEKITNVDKSKMELNTDAAKTALKNEMEQFFVHTMFDAQSKTFNQLMTSDYTIADKSLAFLYGAMPGADGKLKFAEPGRRGLLGLGGFLAAYTFGEDTNPVTRGVFISERLLCTDFSMPPAVNIPEPKPGQSNKDRFAMHSTHELCAKCHATIDGLGFAVDNFGSNANFVNAPLGSQVEIDGSMKAFMAPTDIGKEIGASTQGKSCYAKQVFRYALGRVENAKHKILGAPKEFKETTQTQLDQCQVDTAVAKMDAAGGDLKAAFIAYISSPAFRLRVPARDEGSPLGLTSTGDDDGPGIMTSH